MLQIIIATVWPKIWAASNYKIVKLMKVHKQTLGSLIIKKMLERTVQEGLPDASFPFDAYGNYIEPVTPPQTVQENTSAEPLKNDQ